MRLEDVEKRIDAVERLNGELMRDRAKSVLVETDLVARLDALEKGAKTAVHRVPEKEPDKPELSAYQKALEAASWRSTSGCRKFAESLLRSAAEAVPDHWELHAPLAVERTAAILALIPKEAQ